MGCNTSQEATKDEKSAENNESRKDQSPSKTQQTPPPSGKSEEKPEHNAAIKIQAVFRGHRTRKSIIMKPAQQAAVQPQNKVEPEPTKAELEAEFRADDKDLCNAATMIQASFRGHQSRKQAEQVKQPEPTKEDEELDIDLTDPELNKAATKIQASFRGHKVRKETDY